MSRASGTWGEAQAAAYLRQKGYQLIAHSYHCRFGEIDLIAQKGKMLCFVEVKTRTLGSQETGLEAVTWRKRCLLIRAAYAYCERHDIDADDWYIRYDIADVTAHHDRIIDIDYLEKAFDETDFHDNSQIF